MDSSVASLTGGKFKCTCQNCGCEDVIFHVRYKVVRYGDVVEDYTAFSLACPECGIEWEKPY